MLSLGSFCNKRFLLSGIKHSKESTFHRTISSNLTKVNLVTTLKETTGIAKEIKSLRVTYCRKRERFFFTFWIRGNLLCFYTATGTVLDWSPQGNNSQILCLSTPSFHGFRTRQCCKHILINIPYSLEWAPRHLLNFRATCAFSRAAFIWEWRLFKIWMPQSI